MTVERFPDRSVTVNGKTYLYFGGTAYLGLPTHPDFQDALIKSIAKWGTFYGSSRNSNIKLSIFEKAEKLMAKQIGTEKALTTSSGTLAGKLVLEHLSKTQSTFYHYPKTHPAILHDTSLPLFEKGTLHKNLLNDKKEDIVITVDAILALEVVPTPFDFLNKISPKKQITLVVDESHSLGVLGGQGNGIFSTIKNKIVKRKIMIASLGKALGLSGGLIASDANFINAIKNEVLFVSSSCANAAYLETYVASQHLLKTQQEKLRNNLRFLFKDLSLNDAFKCNENYPVIYCNYEKIYDKLIEKGIIITNFKYPNYKDEMNRIVITANHTYEDLTLLKQVLKSLSKIYF